MVRAIACLVLVVVPGVAAADVVSIEAAHDSTVYAEDGTLGNGAGEHLFTGLTQDGFERRGLVQFDVAAAIPAGSTITAVTLELDLSRTRTADLEVGLHRVLAAWGEGTSDAPLEEGGGAPASIGDVTWTYAFYPTTAWTPGGVFVAVASASALIPRTLGVYGWTGPGLVDDVQGWLDGTLANHGWMLIAVPQDTRETKRFDTHENATPAARPHLIVTFTAAAPTGACCPGDGSCAIVLSPGTACTGTYQGTGSTCVPNPCPQPTGACCLPDAAGTCVDVTAASCASQGGGYVGDAVACASGLCPVVLTPFVDPLPIPPVATPTSGSAGGLASYQIAIREVSQQLHRDLPPTRVWGFDDGTGTVYPGPTIEARRGAAVTVTWTNDLRDESGALRTTHRLDVDACVADDAAPRTVIHLHGGHVPAASDGYPEATQLPGQSAVYEYPNAQPAATLWYHDHAMGITRLNVTMGLAGFYLLRDDAEAALGLPAGADEIALAIQDRSLRGDGSLFYPAAWQDEVLGEVIVVNGAVWPYLDVRRGKYRFRILDGSTSRRYRLSLSDGASLTVIGSDGGLLAAPVVVPAVSLTPGERADVVIDFAGYPAGTEVILRDDAVDIMKFVVGSTAGHTAPLPASLVPVPALAEADAAQVRELVLDRTADPCTGTQWTINGATWEQITEEPQLGTIEVWRFVNPSGEVHPMHLHLVQFQIIDRQPITVVGGVPTPSGPAVAPAAVEAGWKDTVAVGPLEIVRVIARFDDYAGLFPYHCHMLEHEDNAMMRQFRTVAAPTVPDGGVDGGGTGVDAGADAGAGTSADDGGCGCGTGGDAGGGALLVVLLAIGSRGRPTRRRRCRRCRSARSCSLPCR